ncbi:MAG: hypothetical protein DME45_09780, partial [Verrucomicrobia bacterium]
SIPRPAALTAENVFAVLRKGGLRLTSPPCSFADLTSAIYLIFLAHPFRRRQRQSLHSGASPEQRQVGLESKSQT